MLMLYHYADLQSHLHAFPSCYNTFRRMLPRGGRHQAHSVTLLGAGGRQILAAAPAAMPSAPGMAPAGAAAKPMADILFTVLAPSAQLSTDALVLQHVAPLVPFYRSDGNTGLYTTGAARCKLSSACVVSL